MTTTQSTQRPTPPATSLITGGAGFIGSHLADRLLRAGETVRVVDDLSTGRRANLAHLDGHPRLQFVRGDVRDAALVNALADGCQRVYHLAAVVGVTRVLADPLEVMENNILGTRAVLEAARRAGAALFLASTSEVYGKNVQVPFSEDADAVLGPPQVTRWSYATSKAVDEVMAYGYARRHGLRVVVGRFFNTIGQRQVGQYGMVVPRFVAQALGGRPVTVFGTGEQTRSFCDVRDTIRAVTGLMGDPSAAGRAYNIGSAREITILELARQVLDRLDPARLRHPDAIRTVPYEAAYREGYEEFPRRVPDTTRIRDQIGWTPEYTLPDSLDWIAEGMAASGHPGRRHAHGAAGA